jgi:hypothetical protein
MAIATRRRDDLAIGRSIPSVHLPPEDWTVLECWHPNVLIAGTAPAIAAVLGALHPVLRPSTAYWQADQILESAPPAAPETLIVRDLSALSHIEQKRLLDWLVINAGATQVVSATPVGLLKLVEEGSFEAALYYALNVVYFDLFE